MNYEEMKALAWKARKAAEPMSLPAIILMLAKFSGLSTFHSYNPLNAALRLCIIGQFKFGDNDFIDMEHNQDNRYYPNAIESYLSHHSQSRGQYEYSLACSVNNVSACRAFEKYFDIKPYKVGEKRATIGSEYYITRGKRIRPTGYHLERKVILCVLEEYDTEQRKWNKTKHPSFDNKSWREFVKANNNFKEE